MKHLLIFLLIFSSCNAHTQDASSLELSPKEFQSKISPDVVLLDVRTPGEVADGKLAGAINVDFKNETFQKQILTLDKSKTFMVYCASGARSGRAAEWMRSEGFENVITLKGGVRAWIDEGFEVVRE